MDEKQRERTIQKYSSKQNSHEAEAKKNKNDNETHNDFTKWCEK